jgi:integrase/recombinase XerD
MTVITRHAVPYENWPSADQALWQAVIAEGDILDGCGPGANWAPTTKNNTRKAYGYWLHWLGVNGLLSKPTDHPLDRITPEHIKGYIGDMEENAAPLTRFVYILDLLRFAQASTPDRNWDWLKRVKNKLWARATPFRDKTSKIRNSGDLFELGLNLMNESAGVKCRYNPFQEEVQYRDGLLIAILAARPIRLKNLTAIIIGNQLIRIDNHYWLLFEAQDVKNHRYIEVPVPEILTSYIDEYLADCRPRLLQGKESDRFWISRFGGNLTCNSIRRQIKLHTEAAFGKAINPHLFRDCAATSIAIHDPEHVWITANILGHNTLATAQKYYDQSRMLEAGRHYQSTITDLLDTLKEEARSPYRQVKESTA